MTVDESLVPAPTAPAPTPVMEARDVTVRFGGLTALSEVSLTIPPSSIVGLIGPNGAGKSTMFAVLSGLLRPVSGSVLLHNEDVSRLSPQRRGRLGLARTFQQPQLFQSLTVRQHIVLGWRARHTPRRVWSDLFDLSGFRRPSPAEVQRCNEIIELLGIGDIADRVAASLPLGTSRLVEVARALAYEPKVLLLDEPCSGLEHAETTRLANALRTVRAYNISLLLVEHDVELVMSLSDSLFVLDFGRLIASGPPDIVRRDPNVLSAYLGDDPVNAAKGVS
jgi:ABC-type branched-subunit amino acid transport system ATPase component